MPKWARTTRAGAYRTNLGEASGKQGTRQVHVEICTTFFRGIVQDGAEGYVRCYSYNCCGWCFSWPKVLEGSASKPASFKTSFR